MSNILILEDDGIKKRKWTKKPIFFFAALVKYQMVYNAFDVLMPRNERDGECILPDVEFGIVELK